MKGSAAGLHEGPGGLPLARANLVSGWWACCGGGVSAIGLLAHLEQIWGVFVAHLALALSGERITAY